MRIVAIGGGEIGRPGYPIETRAIDKEIMSLTGKKHPKVLLLPTASGDSEIYYPTFEKYYGKQLGCKTDVLYLIKEKPSTSEIESKIINSDIIYVGGGNTLRMLKVWRRSGVDKILEKANKKNIILAGVSAGAICWMKYGNSNFREFDKSEDNELGKLKGLNFVNLMVCPHYDVEKNRRPSLMNMIKKHGGIAIALENCSALEIIDDKYRIITSKKGANAYKLHKSKGKVIEEKLPLDKKFKPLKELRRRS